MRRLLLSFLLLAGCQRPLSEVDVANHLNKSVVILVVKRGKLSGFGSGFVISDGRILTCAHVVGKKGRKVTIIYKDGERGEGIVIESSRFHDMAVVSTSFNTLKFRPEPIAIRNDIPEVGEDAAWLGHPFGVFYVFSRGSIVRYVSIEKSLVNWSMGLQGLIGPGDSGSPVVDSNGYLIGIVTTVWMHSSPINPLPVLTILGFSPSVNRIRGFLESRHIPYWSS